MTTNFRNILSTIALLSAAGASTAFAGGSTPDSGANILLAQNITIEAPKLAPKGNLLRVPVKPELLRRNCPDPAITDVSVRILSRTSPTTARVRITATLKNVGRAAFASGAGQQSAVIYETRPGGQARVAAQLRFTNLAPGQSMTLHADRDWDSAHEFPSVFKGQILYDPDIYIDGNQANDDCNKNNNSRVLDGSAINAVVNTS